MLVDLIPRIVLKEKIKARQRRMGYINSSNSSLVTLDDYLLTANQAALEYFEQDKNPLRKIWEYHHLEPHCGSYSICTYASFLSLTDNNNAEFQEDVRWVGGFYICLERLEDKKARGHHAWLEKKVNNKWQPFETIPDMREMSAFYLPWYTFQLSQGRSKITSEQSGGLFAASNCWFD